MRSLATAAGLALVTFGATLPALAADPGAVPLPRFDLPVDCTGTACVVQSYFDHDPGPGRRDYRCGPLGYDGHTGTDIRVPNLKAMRRGVPVLAAAPGRVRAVRDGMPDVSVREAPEALVQGRGAGNSVAVEHEGGWETQYSHLLNGSVAVRPGDPVVAGQRLGLMGLSGNTEFPHLELVVRLDGRPVDPFVGLEAPEGCGPGSRPLWNDRALAALAYQASGLLGAGFAAAPPESRRILEGEYQETELPADAPALIFWVEVFGVRSGDREHLRLVAPDGKVLAEHRASLSGNKARQERYVGKRRRGAPWPAGAYRGEYRLTRGEGGEAQDVLSVTRELIVR
jgi:hypothetical protein